MKLSELVRSIAVAFALQVTPFSAAEDTSPPSPTFDLAQPTLSKPPAIGFQIGATEILFEEVPLVQIQRLIGRGNIGHRGDAAESTYWLCYTVSKGGTHRIWFTAGELDGPSHLVSGITALRLPSTSDAAADCPTLPLKLLISPVPRVWLGMTEEQAESALGPPSSASGDVREWAYLGTVAAKQGTFDRSSYVRVELKADRVVQVSAGQTTTN